MIIMLAQGRDIATQVTHREMKDNLVFFKTAAIVIAIVRAIWSFQAASNSRMEEGVCLVMKDIGKPCTGKPYARFDEGGQGNLLSTLAVISLVEK